MRAPTRDQMFALRAVAACGSQAELARRMGVRSATAVVALLVSGDRGITEATGFALAVATQGTADPITLEELFPHFYRPLPSIAEHKAVIDARTEIARANSEKRAANKRRRIAAKRSTLKRAAA